MKFKHCSWSNSLVSLNFPYLSGLCKTSWWETCSLLTHTHVYGALFITLVLQKGVCEKRISRKETISALAEGIVKEKQNVWNVECNRLCLNIPFEKLSQEIQGHFFLWSKHFIVGGENERGLLGARIFFFFCHLILDNTSMAFLETELFCSFVADETCLNGV